MNIIFFLGKFFCEINYVFWVDVGGEMVFRLLVNWGYYGNLVFLVLCICYFFFFYIKIELDERVFGNKIVKLYVFYYLMVLYNFILYKIIEW